MNNEVMDFVRRSVQGADVAGRHVLEVGSLDVNGSVRSILSDLSPAEYMGVDVAPGKGVDQVLSVSRLTQAFGEDSFDVVLSTEMLEHVQDWQWAVGQMKRVTRPGGLLVVTTRSPGFHHHGYPHDFWRFTEKDFATIFSDMESVRVQSDQSEPGVFVAARKPANFTECSLQGYEVSLAPPRPPGSLRAHAIATLRRRSAGFAQRIRSWR
jgi:SAM-dependent methyltransferase